MAKTEPHRAPRSLGRLFGDLKVRPKLIVLHNAFFLILACAAWFSLIPLFEERVANAELRENSLLIKIFSDDRPLPKMRGTEIYNFQEGTAEELKIPPHVREWLDANPGLIWRDVTESDIAWRKSGPAGQYRRLRMPDNFYRDMIGRAKRTLFLVLGAIYALAVFSLEFAIMPQYVYRPIKLFLRADRAVQEDDRAQELIRDEEIRDDEIGQIMRSRNTTVRELREHENSLARALEEVNAKNEMLEAAKKHLEDQDRLASIGMLSASVAHEINTPLTVLHGSIEKLLETAPTPAARDRLARMLRVTQRMRRISESLVDFARVRRQEVERIAVRPIVEEAWSLLAIDDKAAGIRYGNLVDAQAFVMGNTDRLVQVFVNLLRNSLNAVSPSGSIVVSSSVMEEAGKTWVAITVEDDGGGIPPDVLPGIFDAFVSTRLDAKGTGLGLTVSDGIVRQHGGWIRASNRPGGGAKLEVKLPYA